MYHDDYPALYVGGEETQVQQLGTYHQYQSFTDVAAIEGKLVISSSWHPNYTGMDLQKSLMNVNSYFLESYLNTILMLFILVTLLEKTFELQIKIKVVLSEILMLQFMFLIVKLIFKALSVHIDN